MDKAKLVEMYPTILVQNRTSHIQHVFYSNGDSAQIQPGARARISTAGLGQIPDQRIIKLIEPTVAKLVEYEILEAPSTAQPPSTPTSGS